MNANRGLALVRGMWAPILLAAIGCSGGISGGGGGESGSGGGESGSGGGGGGGPIEIGPCKLELPLRRLTDTQYHNSVREIFGGKVAASDKFPLGEIGSSATGFSTEPAVNVVTKVGAEGVLDSAEEVALAVVSQLGELLPCAAAANEACAQTFINQYGRAAFRRPVTSAEEATLLGVYRQGAGEKEAFKLGIALVTSAMLQSPEFLYIVEVGSATAEADVKNLSDYELASRLSFLFWDSGPDATLLDAAQAGALRDESELRAQADRLLSDARARPVVNRFAREWLALTDVKVGDRVPKEYDAAMVAAQQRELELFVEEAFLGAGTVSSLLSSQESFVDKRMAAFYGMSGAGRTDGTFEKANTGQPERAGILTLPAVLTSKSHSDEPAYVFRGTFVLEKMMCFDLPLPPAGAAQMLPDFPADATQREKSALIQGVERCVSCHQIIDPIGLSFEGFDEIGRVRSNLPKTGAPIDATGAVVDVDAEIDGAFASPRELGKRLAASELAQRCVARQAFRFAFSRGDQDADACAIDDLMNRFAGQAGGGLRDLLVAVTQLESFRKRKITGGQP